MTRIAVFDLDGTLVDSAPDIHAAVNRMLATRGLAPYGLAEVQRMIGDGVRVTVEHALSGRGQPFDPACVDLLMADEAIVRGTLTRLFDGIPAALDRIAASGWGLAVCTNKPAAAAHGVLGALGLGGRFRAIGGGDSFPARKPDPAHLRATLEAAGGCPEQAVMIGDHRNDVQAAAGCGVPCVFAAWGYGPIEMAAGAPVARAPAELPELIAAAGRG